MYLHFLIFLSMFMLYPLCLLRSGPMAFKYVNCFNGVKNVGVWLPSYGYYDEPSGCIHLHKCRLTRVKWLNCLPIRKYYSQCFPFVVCDISPIQDERGVFVPLKCKAIALPLLLWKGVKGRRQRPCCCFC